MAGAPRASTAWVRPASACRSAWNRPKLVFIINSKRALRGIEKGEVKLGAGAGITVVTLSSAAEGATTTHGGDMVVWASGTGAYGGLTFNGTVIKQDKDDERGPGHRPGGPGPAQESGQHLVTPGSVTAIFGVSFGASGDIPGAPFLTDRKGNPMKKICSAGRRCRAARHPRLCRPGRRTFHRPDPCRHGRHPDRHRHGAEASAACA